METLESLLSSLDPNRTVYIRGISKDATLIDIINHFNKGGDINENDIIFHPINKGIIYITYHDEDSAKTAIQTLNQTELLNVTINVRNFIHKVDSNNKKSKKLNINKDPIVQRKPRNKSKYYNIENNHNHNNNDINITYTCNSIMINYIEYPIPSGKYLLQLLQLSSLGIENDNKIIYIIFNINNTIK
jgi:RNA recognition motif-containing protein